MAGGTNAYSAVLADEDGLVQLKGFGGFAYGGYARKTIGQYLNALEEREVGARLENYPEVMEECLEFATRLVSTVKRGKRR